MNSKNISNTNKMCGRIDKIMGFLIGKLPMQFGLIMSASIIFIMSKNLISGNLNSGEAYFAIMSIAIMSFVLYLGIVMYIQENKKSKKKQ